ncbi:MAG: hypothetical protein LBJ00_10195 [Planctomycetaceae bacterium]|nr:hypothetical protein [Planctomycetaceae bacterium]
MIVVMWNIFLPAKPTAYIGIALEQPLHVVAFACSASGILSSFSILSLLVNINFYGEICYE